MWHSVFGVAFGVALLAFVPNCRGEGDRIKCTMGKTIKTSQNGGGGIFLGNSLIIIK